jgi:hypothetical protein
VLSPPVTLFRDFNSLNDDDTLLVPSKCSTRADRLELSQYIYIYIYIYIAHVKVPHQLQPAALFSFSHASQPAEASNVHDRGG